MNAPALSISSWRDSITAFQAENPHLAPAGGMPTQGGESATYSCEAGRIVQAGGMLAQLLAHPAFIPFEYLFRKLPREGIYQATPQKNFTFDLGRFRVPAQMAFALIDYRFDIYRFSGAAAFDYVPIESRRLSGQIGYDVTVADYRKSNLRFELEPGPITNGAGQTNQQPPSGGIIAAGAEFNQVFPPQIGNPFFPPSAPPFGATPAEFMSAASASSASPGGPGLSLLPQRTERQGALALPFTMIARENQELRFKSVVFRRVPIPVAFFECDVTGVLMPMNVLDQLLQTMAPCAQQGRASGR